MSTVTPVNQATYFKAYKVPDLVEKVTQRVNFVGVRGVIFYIYSADQAGTYSIDVKIAGVWHELATKAIIADHLEVVDVTYYIPNARVRFTAAVADAVLTVEAHGYPSVFIREQDTQHLLST